MKTKIGMKMTFLAVTILPQLSVAASVEHTALQLVSITGNENLLANKSNPG
jgi:hypothetical protein